MSVITTSQRGFRCYNADDRHKLAVLRGSQSKTVSFEE
jgi:hypothetical protein